MHKKDIYPDSIEQIYLFEYIIQKTHVSLLGFDGVGKESVGFLWNDLFLWWPLHTDDERSLGDVLLYNGSCFLIELKKKKKDTSVFPHVTHFLIRTEEGT